MLQAAENAVGPYIWGQYDLLVLPPSFPYGGMENPCLTFVTPTLLVCAAMPLCYALGVGVIWSSLLAGGRSFTHICKCRFIKLVVY